MAHDDDPERIPLKQKPLSVLLMEDDPNDAELCRRMLRKHGTGITLDVASTFQDFADRLRAFPYDLILTDYNLGKWTAEDALNLLRTEKCETPIILVTGTIGEEKAVGCIKDGMADFILKDRLERLPIAISRALQEKNLRDENRRAVNTLRESEAKFRALADAIPAAIFIEEHGKFVYVNRAAEEITGYNRDELTALNFSQFVHPDSKDAVIEHQAKRSGSEQSPYRVEIMIQPKGREPRWVDITVGTFTRDGLPATLTTAFDISERKRANREIQFDPFTGLPNQAHLVTVFDSEALRTKRTERPFSLLVLWLDGIKQIALEHGQLAAAQALNRAARTTRLHCRNLDTVARVGTHQFAVILPETDMEGALILGGRIAARLAKGDQESQITCRFAAAAHPMDGDALKEVLDMAIARCANGPRDRVLKKGV